MDVEYMDWKGWSLSAIGSTATFLSRFSLDRDLIPRKWPICHMSVDSLVLHHWEGGSIGLAVRLGFYRRLCPSCNSRLGSRYRGEYPSWEDQKAFLYCTRGDWWSLITKEEVEYKDTRGEVKKKTDGPGEV